MTKVMLSELCRHCNKVHELKVNQSDLERFNAGEHVQSVMPYLSPGERELLITRICGTCFDEIMGEDE